MKNQLPYYKRYPRDFLEGTVGMDLECKGAYAIILDLIYIHGGHLTDDEKWISGNLGCKVSAWRRVRETLLAMGKIEISEGKITNSRALFEVNQLKNWSETQRNNAAGSRKNKDIDEANDKIRQRQPEPEPEPLDKKKPEASKKGTRIADDFEPDVQAAVEIGLRPERALSEAAKFKDYWASATGAKATKMDWHKTWMVWARSAVDRQGGPRGSPAQGRSAFRQHQDDVTRNLERAANERSSNDYGQPAFDLDATAFRSDRTTPTRKP